MRKILLVAMAVFAIALTGCSKDGEDGGIEISPYEDVFEITDKYVRWLDTLYDSFGLVGKSEKTSDGEYQVAGIGRLIIVKIMSYAPDSEYEALERALDKRYDNDRRVNDVFVNEGGTVTIDCRD